MTSDYANPRREPVPPLRSNCARYIPPDLIERNHQAVDLRNRRADLRTIARNQVFPITGHLLEMCRRPLVQVQPMLLCQTGSFSEAVPQGPHLGRTKASFQQQRVEATTEEFERLLERFPRLRDRIPAAKPRCCQAAIQIDQQLD